jgi:methylmalonyl-CoA/ethylmalonyl-CoA epimerase
MRQNAPSSAHPERLDHIGIVTNDMDAARDLYERVVGLRVTHEEILSTSGLHTVMLESDGLRIELLCPVREDTAVARFLERRGPGLHHLALRVADIHLESERMAACGLEPLSAEPEAGVGGSRTLFFHPKSSQGVLLELVAPSSEPEGTDNVLA